MAWSLILASYPAKQLLTTLVSENPIIDGRLLNSLMSGPMTRDVLDNALLLTVLAAADGLDDRQVAGTPFPGQIDYYSSLKQPSTDLLPLKNVKIGVLKEAFEFPGMNPRVSSKIREATHRFEELGAEILNVSMPLHSQGSTLWMTMSRLSGSLSRAGKATGRQNVYLNDLLHMQRMKSCSQSGIVEVGLTKKDFFLDEGSCVYRYANIFPMQLYALPRKYLRAARNSAYVQE
jgi:hypothetical protein